MTVPVIKDPIVKAMYTTIGWSPTGRPIVVAYDCCGRCGQHLTNCACEGGPKEPGYITKLRESDANARSQAVAPPAESLEATGVAQTPNDWEGNFTGRPDAEVMPPARKAVAHGLPRCKVCGKQVTDDDADRNDDGTWTCYDDQAGAAR